MALGSAKAVAQYLSRYAEPEASLAAALPGTAWGAAIVVPACAEEPALLDGVTRAAVRGTSPTLVVVVVNGAEGAADAVHDANARLLSGLFERMDGRRTLSNRPGMHFGHSAGFDLLVVDRASLGFRLSRRDALGRSRRIGCDVVLALHARGALGSPWIHWADADATLPDDALEVEARLAAPATSYSGLVVSGAEAVAVTLPFAHEACGDEVVDRATFLHEIALRYWARGLAWAGSSWAYPALGSALAVHADAYAVVRGVPRRAAGEDFHLLAKLAKIGRVARLAGEPVRIRARRSERAPFGTGAAVRKVESGRGSEVLYDPAVFRVVRAFVRALAEVMRSRDFGTAHRALDKLDEPGRSAARAHWERLGAEDALRKAVHESPSDGVLHRRLHGWLDALRTLRLVHHVRDEAYPSIPWRDALAKAPFTAGARDAIAGPLEGVCTALADGQT